ncbi:MAG: NAD-dependent succinate-semialdehyde dehydrogenase [Verrucomicrobiales bacterium]|nr:NAD-dependent succinate-semialdehyde dehydrogenase [Verrucomicrobiales bacterium]
MRLFSVNPATGEPVADYPQDTDAVLHQKLLTTASSARTWRHTPFEVRARHLQLVAKRLRARAAEFARLMALEMGKPITQGRAEIEKCAATCDFYANHAAAFLNPEPVATEARQSLIAFNPLGVVLAVMPWNFPFWQVIRCAAPALMAGNGVALKHASNVTGCALALGELFQGEDSTRDLFTPLLAGSDRLAGIIAHPAVAAIALTGSVQAGRSVAALAGTALKKCVLELGGSDAYLILDDADVPMAAEACAWARLVNAGQSCIAAKRFLVLPGIRREFEERLAYHLSRARIGDPLDPGTEIGPLARADIRDELQSLVEGSLAAGARCTLGGKVPDGRGCFYPPTLLLDVAPTHPVFQEETFGPVAAVCPAATEADALRLANQSRFGLGGAIFSRDIHRATALARDHLDAGSCFVNTFVRSDARLPFGGIKESGYGRELGLVGIREFQNIKSVFVA